MQQILQWVGLVVLLAICIGILVCATMSIKSHDLNVIKPSDYMSKREQKWEKRAITLMFLGVMFSLVGRIVIDLIISMG